MSLEFFQTGYGRRFFEAQLPDLIKQTSRLAEAAERIAAALEALAKKQER
jgi:hypothetical protein